MASAVQFSMLSEAWRLWCWFFIKPGNRSWPL